jgi:hypothetical protein
VALGGLEVEARRYVVERSAVRERAQQERERSHDDARFSPSAALDVTRCSSWTG